MPFLSNTKFRGMNSLRRSTEIGAGEAADVLNSEQGSSSQAGPMKGYSRFGNQANAANSIVRVYNYVKQDGVEVLLQVRDNGTNYIVEYLNTEDIRNSENGEWSILEASLTRSRTLSDGSTKPARIDFAPFNDTGSNQLVYGNGIEAMRIWNGATGAISSTTVNTIVLTGTATLAQRGFAASGSVIINGTSYAYTGISAQTFTGVGTDPTGEANGSGVAQVIDTSTLSAADKGSILLSTQSRLFLAGISATPNQVTFSDVGDVTNYTGANPADGGFEDFPQMNGDITALSYLDDWIIVFSANKIIAFKFQFPSSTTRVTIRKDIADEGCASYKAIRKFSDQIIYITPKGGIKRLSQLSSENVFNVDDLTSKISPTIKNFIWDDSAIEFLRKDRIIIAAGKSDSDQTVNNKAISMHLTLNQDGGNEINLGIMDWYISDMAIYGGNLHFGAGFSSRNYKAFDGYSKDGAPYIWRRTERVENFGNAWTKKDIKFLAVRGLIGAGTTLNIKVKYGINGSTSVSEMELDFTEDGEFIVQQALNTLGGFELGTEPLGGTIDEVGELNPFSVMFPLPDIIDREMQVEFGTDGSGQRVAIDSYAFGTDNADFVSDEEEQTIDNLKDLGV